MINLIKETNLVKTEEEEAGGLKDQVLLDSDIGAIGSTAETVGEVLLPGLKISESFKFARDSGERTTEPGVILGSSSILLIIWLP